MWKYNSRKQGARQNEETNWPERQGGYTQRQNENFRRQQSQLREEMRQRQGNLDREFKRGQEYERQGYTRGRYSRESPGRGQEYERQGYSRGSYPRKSPGRTNNKERARSRTRRLSKSKTKSISRSRSMSASCSRSLTRERSIERNKDEGRNQEGSMEIMVEKTRKARVYVESNKKTPTYPEIIEEVNIEEHEKFNIKRILKEDKRNLDQICLDIIEIKAGISDELITIQWSNKLWRTWGCSKINPQVILPPIPTMKDLERATQVQGNYSKKLKLILQRYYFPLYALFCEDQLKKLLAPIFNMKSTIQHRTFKLAVLLIASIHTITKAKKELLPYFGNLENLKTSCHYFSDTEFIKTVYGPDFKHPSNPELYIEKYQIEDGIHSEFTTEKTTEVIEVEQFRSSSKQVQINDFTIPPPGYPAFSKEGSPDYIPPNDQAFQSPGIHNFPGPVPLLHPPISNSMGYQLPAPVYEKHQAMDLPAKTFYQAPPLPLTPLPMTPPMPQVFPPIPPGSPPMLPTPPLPPRIRKHLNMFQKRKCDPTLFKFQRKMNQANARYKTQYAMLSDRLFQLKTAINRRDKHLNQAFQVINSYEAMRLKFVKWCNDQGFQLPISLLEDPQSTPEAVEILAPIYDEVPTEEPSIIHHAPNICEEDSIEDYVDDNLLLDAIPEDNESNDEILDPSLLDYDE